LARRISDAERADIIAALQAGVSIHEVAQRFGRSKSTISRLAHEAGVETERSQVKQATDARKADNAFRLEQAKTMLLDEFYAAMGELHDEAKVVKFHSGDWYETTLDEPNFLDKRNILWRAGGAIANYKMIVELQGGGGDEVSAVDEWLNEVAPE
jgi:transposase-like protein